jgi:hypothetical protein
MLKMSCMILAGAMVLSLSAGAAFADNTGKLMNSSSGVSLGSTGDMGKYPIDPQTGKRPGVIDWEGAGKDISQHPDGPHHDFQTCGICK